MTTTHMLKPFERRYPRIKHRLLNNPEIHPTNRDLFRQFLDWEEYKLTRINNLHQLDEGTFKTLYVYVQRLQNVNRWFENKPLPEITREDIKRVYDALEDGRILNKKGQPYKTRQDYYSKIFKSKLFKLAGKDDLACEVIQFARPTHREVRFVREADFRRITEHVRLPRHRTLIWLAWDIGENIGALLQLRKADCYRQTNPDSGEPEYRINLRRETLKRSRKARAEITNFTETTRLLDMLLDQLETDDLLFPSGYRAVKKVLDRAVDRAQAKCEPNGEKVTWKDLRSGMACDLLLKGWTTDEVNARLGHTPSSDEIDHYINFLALDRHRPKARVNQHESTRLTTALRQSQQREEQLTKQQNEFSKMFEAERERMRQELDQLRRVVLGEVQSNTGAKSSFS